MGLVKVVGLWGAEQRVTVTRAQTVASKRASIAGTRQQAVATEGEQRGWRGSICTCHDGWGEEGEGRGTGFWWSKAANLVLSGMQCKCRQGYMPYRYRYNVVALALFLARPKPTPASTMNNQQFRRLLLSDAQQSQQSQQSQQHNAAPAAPAAPARTPGSVLGARKQSSIPMTP
jgi:hypothetical protein